jgi:hypothetical protein
MSGAYLSLLRFLTGAAALNGLPIFTPCNIGITDSEYTASLVSGLMLSLVILCLNVFTGIFSFTDISDSVNPFIFPLYGTQHNKSISVRYKVQKLLHSRKEEFKKFVKKSENIFEKDLTKCTI